jgi:YHS domain-containing protein
VSKQFCVSFFVLTSTVTWAALTFGCDNKLEASPSAAPPAAPVPATPQTASSRPSAATTLVRVQPEKVCMINDRFMDAPQIPVAVEGKTYYGCCPMCERRLREEPNSRFGIDPVSKKRVDKAAAVIGKLTNGEVLYFENEQTFGAYQQRT